MTLVQRFDVGARMSEMAVHNGVCYLAGQVAEDGSQDIYGQTRQVLAAIDALLAKAGTDKTRILRARSSWPTSGRLSRRMNAVWDSLGGGRPHAAARHRAGRTGQAEWKVEIVVTAAV
jgi:enamine deaminase RidA (YjgF/YER057c/UK114 family)